MRCRQERLAASDVPGNVGRYQIIEELGRGGMGRVCKVVGKEVHANVALELIRPQRMHV